MHLRGKPLVILRFLYRLASWPIFWLQLKLLRVLCVVQEKRLARARRALVHRQHDLLRTTQVANELERVNRAKDAEIEALRQRLIQLRQEAVAKERHDLVVEIDLLLKRDHEC